jgi:hypothetical protein
VGDALWEAEGARLIPTAAAKADRTVINSTSSAGFPQHLQTETLKQRYQAAVSCTAALQALQLLQNGDTFPLELSNECIGEQQVQGIDAAAAEASLLWCAQLLQSPARNTYLLAWHGFVFCKQQLHTAEQFGEPWAEELQQLQFLPGSTHSVDDVHVCVCGSYISWMEELKLQEIPLALDGRAFEFQLGLQKGQLDVLWYLLGQLAALG